MSNCVNCGAPLPEGSTFCTNCGSKVTAQAASETTQTQTTYTAPNQPAQQNVYVQTAADPGIGIGEWMLTMFLTGIPIVGFIMLLVWAFSGGTNPNKKNWAIAALIWGIIGVAISFLFGSAIVALIMNAAQH